MIPLPYRIAAAIVLLLTIFTAGYLRGRVTGSRGLAECQAAQDQAERETRAQGSRLDALNAKLAEIAQKQTEAVKAAGDAAEAARKAGRSNEARARALPVTGCDLTARAVRDFAPDLARQWRGDAR